MKIAYITHSFPPMGYAAAINTYRIVKGLVDRGHELIVFCAQYATKGAAQLELQEQSCHFQTYYSLPTPLPLNLLIPHVFNALRTFKHQYDLLITQFHLWHLATFAGLSLKFLKRKPLMIKVHDMIPDPTLPVFSNVGSNFYYNLFLNARYGLFVKNLGRRADKVLVLTSELQSLLLEKGYPSNKVAVIPNGVDTNVFTYLSPKECSTNKKTILYVGGFEPEDGLDSLVKAIALLNKEKDLSLILIGGGGELPCLVELVKKLNLEQKVTFRRYIPHDTVPDFVKRSYVGVGPLRLSPINNYTIPTKILEYFACGKPVISSPVSKDVLKDGFTGFVVKSVTPKNIAEKLLILLEDEKLAIQMGKNARGLVVEKFDWEKIMDQLDKESRDLEPQRFN